MLGLSLNAYQFQSMLPVRGATGIPTTKAGRKRFQSMLPVRGATIVLIDNIPHKLISIHAPRAGSDSSQSLPERARHDFNPCSPCGERRFCPQRRCTGRNFNPCSPCGERPTAFCNLHQRIIFQSMLPVRGATLRKAYDACAHVEFQSMLPVRGATAWSAAYPPAGLNFNPCSPCGERHG